MLRALLTIWPGLIVLPFAAAGQDKQLSNVPRTDPSLVALIDEQLGKCWKLPGSGGEIGDTSVVLQWKLEEDGSLDGDVKIANSKDRKGKETVFNIAAEAAVRAVRNCAPFNLPKDRYDAWKIVYWKFDARKMTRQAAADELAVLLEKDPTRKGVPNSATPGSTAGDREGNAPILSVREQEILRSEISAQLRKCWKLPGEGGGIENTVATVRWKLKPDGSLDGEPAIEAPQSGAVFQIAAEAAIRAVKNCAPFKLPYDQHWAWKSIIWDFDPRESLEPKQPVDKEAAAAAEKLYFGKVHAKIAECTPAKPEWNGVATVLFLLMPDGTLISRKIIESSGVPEIDAAALRTLDACRPFDRFDRAMGEVALYSKVRIDFSSRSAGGTGDHLRVAMKEYNAAVFEHLLKHKVNPRTQKAGTVKVAFSVGSKGELLSAEIEESSGHDELDAAALLTLDRAVPYPLPPHGYGGQPTRLHVPFSYSVQAQ